LYFSFPTMKKIKSALISECALVDIKEDNPAPMPPMGGGGMPGMM